MREWCLCGVGTTRRVYPAVLFGVRDEVYAAVHAGGGSDDCIRGTDGLGVTHLARRVGGRRRPSDGLNDPDLHGIHPRSRDRLLVLHADLHPIPTTTAATPKKTLAHRLVAT